MSRKRPTESSWDSDEDLLGDDISGINAFRDEDIDEDALLGESDEEMDAGAAGETIAESINETEETAEDSFITAGDQSQNEPDEEVLDVIVDEDEDEILGISTSEFDDSTYSQYSETTQQRPISSRSSQVQDEPVREPEPLADQNFTQDDPGEDSITLGQDDTADDTEDAPEERPEEEEEEDEESEDEEKHERGRFTSERRNTISLKMKRERDSIPDTLELSAEELAKIEEIQNKIGHQHNYRGGRGNRRGRGRYNNRQHPNQGNHQGMFNMRPGMGPRPNFPGPNRGMHPGQFNPPYPILQQQQHQQQHQQQQHQQQQMRPNMPQGMPQHQQQQQQQGPPMHQGPNNNSPMPAGPSPTPQRPKIHINPHFRGNRPQQTQSAGYTAPQTVPAQTVQSLMTPRPAVGPLLPQPQQGQMPPTSMNMNNMQQRPPHNQPFQQQRPAFSWSGTPQQQQPPQQSQAGFMVGSGPRPPYPQQPFAQPPQQQQQHGMGPQQQMRPQGPMNMQPQQAGSPIMRPPLNQQGARFNFNPNQNQGPQKFNQGGPGFNDQWNRGAQQPPQQQGPPHSQYQGGPLMGQQPMQRPPQQQQPPHQQQQFQPQRPQFDPQHQNQQRFPGPPHSQQQQQFRPQGGGGNFQPRTSPGQQPRFNQPQQNFNSPPRPLQPQGPRQQTPHHMGSQVRPLFQQHGQPQQFGGPHNNRMDTQEEAQPIQTLVSGVNTNTPRRNVKPVPMQPKPLQQRNAQLTDEQKKLLLRKQRFEAAASPAKTAGKISLSSAAKTSQKKLLAAKQFQATKQLQAAAQKRRSVEPPSASPPKQARIMLRRPIQGPDGNTPPVLSSPVKKMVPVSMPAAPAPTPPKPTNTAESMLDADLAAKLENQRKLRERIQRQKELNRQNQAAKKRATLIQTLAEQGLTLDDITDGQSEEMEATPTPVPVQQSPKPMTPTSPQFKVPQGPGFMGPNPTGAKTTAPAPRGKKAVPMTLTQIRNLQSQGKKVTIQGQGRGQGVRGRGRGRGQTQNMMGRGQPDQGQGQMGNQGGIPANQQQVAPMRGQGQNQRKLRGRGMANRGGAAAGRGGQNLTQQGQAPPNQGNNFNPTQNFEQKRGRGVMRGIMQGPARGGMNRQNLSNTMGPGGMGQAGNVVPGVQHPQHQQQQQQQMHHPIQPHNNGQPPKQHQPPSNRTVLAQGMPGQGQVQAMPQGQGQGQGAGNKRRIVLGGGDMVTNTVLIQNLSRSTPRGQVEQMCMQVGQPLTMNVNQQGCFVQFSSPDQAVQFRNRFNRHMIDLSHITVSLVPQS